MKIKIIEPYDFDFRYDQRSLTPSLGPVVVATLLHQEGHEVEVLSEYVTQFGPGEAKDADLVGISITTTNAQRGFSLADQVKRPVVFGGFHASLMPEECLDHGDFVIAGDGFPIVDLVRVLQKGRREDLGQVRNLVYKENGKIVYNQHEGRPIEVVPDFSLVKDYFKLNSRRLLRIPLLVSGSRGCTHDCIFCSIKAVYPEFKKKSVAAVVEDIKTQISHQHFFSRFLPRIIWLTDDNLTSDKSWAKELFKEIAKLRTSYYFTLQIRVDAACDSELLSLMKKARVGRVYLGIETLRAGSLRNFNKNISMNDVHHAIRRFRDFDIDVHGLFVFGDDEFRKGDGKEVADFVKREKLSGALVQPLTPFPGTPLFKKMEEEKRLLHKKWRWYGDKIVFKPQNMTPAELLDEIYDCYRSMFSLARVAKFLFTGKTGFRLEFLGEGLRRHLEWLKMKRFIRDNLAPAEKGPSGADAW